MNEVITAGHQNNDRQQSLWAVLWHVLWGRRQKLKISKTENGSNK